MVSRYTQSPPDHTPSLLVAPLILPVGDVVYQVLLEHVAPFLHHCQQSLLEWPCVHCEPSVYDIGVLEEKQG